MPGSVGGISCDRVIGMRRKMAQRSTVWQIPGIDGYGVHLHGKGDGEHQFRIVKYGSDSGDLLNNWYETVRALQGQVVTIVNEQGSIMSNEFIAAVGEPSSRTAYDLAGNNRRIEFIISAIAMI